MGLGECGVGWGETGFNGEGEVRNEFVGGGFGLRGRSGGCGGGKAHGKGGEKGGVDENVFSIFFKFSFFCVFWRATRVRGRMA